MKTRYPIFLFRAGKASRYAVIRLARLAIRLGASGITSDYLVGECCTSAFTWLLKSKAVRFHFRFS